MKATIAVISIFLMLVSVERTVGFTAVDASWGKRSEKVRISASNINVAETLGIVLFSKLGHQNPL